MNRKMEDANTTSTISDYHQMESAFQEMAELNKSCQHNVSETDHALAGSIQFWVEGVALCTVAVGGLCGNFISVHILSRDDMRNSFNLLLISLLCFDSLYVAGGALESFRRCFKLYHDLHLILFAYFLYPMQAVVMTASIFMTVGIALERYIAVHYPIDYNQSMNSPEACRRRLLKYLIPVVIFSVVFNIPKFLEAEIYWKITVDENATEGGQAAENSSLTYHEQPRLTTTELRRDPNYAIYYNNWTRLAVLGIIPAAMLIYFNYKIWKDIKLRQDRRRQSINASTTIRHQARRRQEDNLAVVFMGIVGAFLLCHLLRIALSLHESLIIRHAMKCMEAGFRNIFPSWAMIANSFSHLFLAVNSSTNMIIYCSLNQQFRRHFVEIIQHLCRCVGVEKLLLTDENGGEGNNNSPIETGDTLEGHDNDVGEGDGFVTQENGHLEMKTIGNNATSNGQTCGQIGGSGERVDASEGASSNPTPQKMQKLCMDFK